MPGISGFAVGALLGWAAAQTPPAGPLGVWLDQSGRAGIDIEPCATGLCGTMVWLKVPLDDQGKPKTDIHNPDEAKRAAPLCGLRLMGDFKPDGDGAWAGGFIYDAEHGDTYKSNMALQADGTLKVRGYIGFSFIGKSQIWTRPAQPLPKCG